MNRENVFVTPEEMAQQRSFTQRLLRRNSARTAENGYVPKALVDCYGCQQNEADAEAIRGILAASGYAVAADEHEADVIIINTCAIREHAEARVLGNIGALSHEKRRRPELIIGVCGCMPQQPQMARKLKMSFPYVDIVFGTHALWKLPQLLWEAVSEHKRVFDVEDSAGRIAEGLPVQRKEKDKAWVSIMYGCNNFCTYCIVPYVRGRERSRRPEDILNEIRGLVAEGYRDFTLLGQNVNSYDGGDCDFPTLLERICAIEGDFTVRFMTSHPKDATKRLFDVIAANPKCARGLHLPVQCGSDRILKAMNRRYTVEQYLELIDYARAHIPGLCITSDIIVGFPGETEEDFQGTLDLVERVRFDSLFTFIYSPRTGTPAATMEDPATHEEKQNRFDRLLAAQNRISQEIHASYIGKVVEVFIDGGGRAAGYTLSGRTDGGRLVHTVGDESLRGTKVRVRVEKGSTYALFGSIVNE